MQIVWVRILFALSLLLLWPAVAFAQTPAQRALEQEPEIRQIRANGASFQQQEAIPKNRIDAPSAGQTLLSAISGLSAQKTLLQQLKDRLESNAEACAFCSRWQEELSELLRQQVALEPPFQDTPDTSDPSSARAQAYFGMGLNGTHWRDKTVATEEMRAVRTFFCRPANNLAALGNAGTTLCSKVKDTEMESLFRVHAGRWGTCLREHDWIVFGGKRVAYEACMQSNDFVTQLCQTRATLRQSPCKRLITVNAEDVLPLRAYGTRETPVRREEDAAPPAAITESYTLEHAYRSDFRPHKFDRVVNDLAPAQKVQAIADLQAIADQQQMTVDCVYGPLTLVFWLNTVPKNLDSLLNVLPDDRLTEIGHSMVRDCPTDSTQARKLHLK